MFTPADIQHLVLAIVFSFVGLLVFALSFVALDKLTPGNLWHEIIDEHNVALAVIMGACALGVSIIIAAALIG